MFLRRLWGQPLDLADGLIALAPATAGVGDRERAAALFREAEEMLAALPRRRACCPSGSPPRRAAGPPPAGAELSERELRCWRS